MEFASAEVKNETRRRAARKVALMLLMLGAIVVLACISISVGAAESVTPAVAFKVLFNQIFPGTFEVPDNSVKIVMNVRLPRILMAICAGAILAVGGCIVQTLLNNPLATPYTLGVSSASALGACLAIAFGINLLSSPFAVATNAFLFSLIPLGVITLFSKFRRVSPVMMVLLGVAMSYIFSACLTIMEYFVDSDTLSSVVFWTVGDLSHSFMWEIPYVATAALALIVFALLLSKPLNTMRMGDDTAKSLGINVDLVRLACVLAACLSTSLVICFIGSIGFICLLAPHICRYIVGGDLRFLIPSTAIMGAILLLVADILSKALISPGLLPVGAITALIGGPALILLLMKTKATTA